MKTLFIETKYTKPITIPKKVIDGTPKKICLFTTVQFIEQLEEMKKQLTGKEITTIMPDHTIYKGQLLGCDVMEMPGDFEAFLYIGDGLFHPKALAIGNKKPIYIYNPFADKFFLLNRTEIENMLRREKGALLKFHTSDNIGIIVTTKPGQHFMGKAEKLKELYPEKRIYMFITNTLDFNDLENYPFVDVFVNTMCPRIGLDDTNKIEKPIINIDVLLKIAEDK
jgi:2-(3-amino-3-carboxypropyl)histidine synthase